MKYVGIGRGDGEGVFAIEPHGYATVYGDMYGHVWICNQESRGYMNMGFPPVLVFLMVRPIVFEALGFRKTRVFGTPNRLRRKSLMILDFHTFFFSDQLKLFLVAGSLQTDSKFGRWESYLCT